MEKVALAIDYAHSKSIIHRDLKPGNIMIDKNDIPYVMDFGLVKLVDVPGQLTKTGDILGTPTYMSPEQAQGDQKLIDTKTDIYSLGVVLYEMLCGQVPFDDCSPWNILVKVIEKKLSSKNPNKGTVRTLHTVTNQNDKVVMTWIANFLIKTKN